MIHNNFPGRGFHPSYDYFINVFAFQLLHSGAHCLDSALGIRRKDEAAVKGWLLAWDLGLHTKDIQGGNYWQ